MKVHFVLLNANTVPILLDYCVQDSTYQWPVLSWARNEGADSGTIGVYTSPAPLSVTAWWADTTNRTCDRETYVVCYLLFRVDNYA